MIEGGKAVTNTLLTESHSLLCASWQVPVTRRDDSDECGWGLSVVTVGI